MLTLVLGSGVALRAQPNGTGSGTADELLDRAQSAYWKLEVRRAAELFEQAGDAARQTDSELAAIAFNNACNARNELGDFERALADCNEAMRLRAPADNLGRARTQNNRGLSLLDLGRLREAESSFRSALALNQSIPDREGTVINYTNLALVEHARGRYQESLRDLDLAQSELDEAAAEPWVLPRRTGIGVNRAVLLTRLGRFDEALRTNRELLDLDLAARERAFVLANLALTVHLQGDPLRAAELLDQAERLYRDLGDVVGVASVRLSRGTVRYEGLGDNAGARDEFATALADSRAAGAISFGIEAAYQLARANLRAGQRQDAESAIDTCRQWSLQVESQSGLASADFAEALLRRQSGDREGAAQLLDLALGRIDRTSRSLHSNLDRGSYLASTREVAEAAVAIAVELGRLGEALVIARRAKERLVAQGAGRDSLGVAASATARETTVPANPQIRLDYFFAEGRLLRWRSSGATVDFSDRGPSEPLDRDLIALHRRLARKTTPANEPHSEQDPLLERIAEQLLGDLPDIGPGELVIAADKRLRYLPFDLLPLPGRSPSPSSSLRDSASAARPVLVVDRVATRYVLGEEQAGTIPMAPAQRGRLVLVAASDAQPARHVARVPLRPLREASAELEGIVKALRHGPREVTNLVGREATKDELIVALAGAPAVDILHIAAHAVFDESSEVGSALLLAAGERDDGAWRPREIAQQVIPARLVVLSACSSALGFQRDGRAVDSLVGALLLAGAEGVVASLWDVGDHNTRIFMEQFYFQLGRGVPAAQALRNTRLRLLEDPSWKDPRLWSAFVLIGESPRFTTGTSRPTTALTIGLVSAAVLLLLAVVALARRRLLRHRPGS